MSRLYDIKEQYLGQGNLAEYTFDFKIGSIRHIIIQILKDDGTVYCKVRGDDTVFVSSVVFDAGRGGGTVTLVANLTLDYNMTLFLAPDEPTQEFEFKNKGSFTLNQIEQALDWLAGPVQRLAYLAARSIKLDDIDEQELFDTTLPSGLVAASGNVIGINTARTRMALYTFDEIAAGVTKGGPFVITNAMATTAVTGMTVNGTVHSSAEFLVEVIRDSTIHMLQKVVLVFLGGVWVLHEGAQIGSGADHGLTWSVTESASIAQVNIASDSSGTGKLKFKRMAFDV